jgi:hypothetical protein
MDQELSSLNGLLERRLRLMRELADSLERAQAAVLESDPGQVSAQTTRQRELCAELRRLASELTPEQVPSPVKDTAGFMPARARRRALLIELAEVEPQVACLNRAYDALLRRARRTVDIFCRVLANSGATYIPPASHPVSAVQNSRR